MKSRICLFGLVLVLLFSLSSCKSKQSAYKKAYDAAKAKELQERKDQSPVVERVAPYEPSEPVARPQIQQREENFQRERITVLDGAGVRLYSVVIGSFVNSTNARSLKERMERQGYKPVLAQNEKGMYRVIVASFDDRARAIAEKNEIRERFAPDFSDAWLLQQER